MAKARSWGDERTNPGVPGPANGETVVGRPKRLSEDLHDGGNGRLPAVNGVVHSRSDNGACVAQAHEKTSVVRVDDRVEMGSKVDATAIVSNPTLPLGQAMSEPNGDVNATVVTQNPLSKGPGGRNRAIGRLVVVIGKEEGRVIEIAEGTKTLGRGKDCDITLLDIQISRRHVEFAAAANGVLVTDLGSGNGTFVNEEPIDSVTLVDGDEISVGDHVLRFEEERPVASAPPAVANRGAPARMAVRSSAGGMPPSPIDVVRRARQRRARGGGEVARKRLLILAGGVLVVVAFAGMALALRPDPDPGDSAEPPVDLVVQRVFAAGMKQFRAERYEEALGEFEAVVAKMPEHREGARYLVAARRELHAARAIEEGRARLEMGDHAGARARLRRVEPESLRVKEAQKLLQQVDEAEAQVSVLEGDAMLQEDILDEARQAFNRALEIVSGFAPAKEGITRVDEREQELRSMSREERERQARLAAQRRQAAQRQARAQVESALGSGERLFDQGDFQRALERFLELSQNSNSSIANPAKKKAQAVRRFRPAYERGMSAAESRAAEQAVRDLAVAERQARIINRGGTTHQEVRGRLADMYHMQGRIAFNGKRYQVAYKNWNDAIKVNPQHRYSRQGLAELREIAENLYLEAYTIRTLNPESAISKFRQVIAMTPGDFEYHRRARQRLAELEN